MTEKRYRVNEVFLSVQGEGVRAGTANVFVRFSGCNLACRADVVDETSPGGFDCDTEFMSGRWFTLDELVETVTREDVGRCGWIIATGGEPALQLDDAFVARFHDAGYLIAVETNGSVELPDGVDWITVSPKVAEHAIRQRLAHEVKYVRAHGQALPRTVVEAGHHLVSPAFDGDRIDARTLRWCVDLVTQNPTWRLSLQTHKLGGRIR